MFALRRAAARAVFTQPTRQPSVLRATQSRISIINLEKPSTYRFFHQSLRWRAEEEEKKASPAEAETSSETVTTEPSAEEQKHVKEESVAAPEVADSAASESQSAIGRAAEKVSDVAQDARSRAFPPSSPTLERQPSKILYIGNLFFEVTAPQLEREFKKYGEVTNSRIVTDNRGLSKGFGYIEYATQDAADEAVAQLNQKQLQGRRMVVQYHVRRDNTRGKGGVPRQPNPPSKTLFIGNMSYQMSDRDLNGM